MATYDSDVVVWADEQAAHIRAGRFDLLDLEHLADEIEDVGKSERRELERRMAALLAHSLKWRYQPDRRGSSWDRTIREQRKRVSLKLKEVPSLRQLLTDSDWIEGVWADAVVEAIKDTSLNFPGACPWSFGDVLQPDWLPA